MPCCSSSPPSFSTRSSVRDCLNNRCRALHCTASLGCLPSLSTRCRGCSILPGAAHATRGFTALRNLPPRLPRPALPLQYDVSALLPRLSGSSFKRSARAVLPAAHGCSPSPTRGAATASSRVLWSGQHRLNVSPSHPLLQPTTTFASPSPHALRTRAPAASSTAPCGGSLPVSDPSAGPAAVLLHAAVLNAASRSPAPRADVVALRAAPTATTFGVEYAAVSLTPRGSTRSAVPRAGCLCSALICFRSSSHRLLSSPLRARARPLVSATVTALHTAAPRPSLGRVPASASLARAGAYNEATAVPFLCALRRPSSPAALSWREHSLGAARAVHRPSAH